MVRRGHGSGHRGFGLGPAQVEGRRGQVSPGRPGRHRTGQGPILARSRSSRLRRGPLDHAGTRSCPPPGARTDPGPPSRTPRGAEPRAPPRRAEHPRAAQPRSPAAEPRPRAAVSRTPRPPVTSPPHAESSLAAVSNLDADMDANALRRVFTQFFVDRGHTAVSSAGLIPHDPRAPFSPMPG